MADLGRFQETYSLPTGRPAAGASVTIRKQGATVSGNQSGTSALTITVNRPGGILSTDKVRINTGTTEYDVDSVTATTVVVSGFLGTLAVNDDDRLTPSTALPSLFNDAASGEALTNPLTASDEGLATAWIRGSFYDVLVSGGGGGTVLYQDIGVLADDYVT